MKQTVTTMVTVLTAIALTASSALAATIELSATPADVGALLRIPVPVKKIDAKAGEVVVLTDENNREVLAQVECAGRDGDAIELVLVRPAGMGKTLRVGKTVKPEAKAAYEAVQDGDRLATFATGGKPMAVYHSAIRELPEHADFNRANFFNPLVTPAGLAVTQDAPEDHLHHRGVFMAFTELAWTGANQTLKGNFWHKDAAAAIAPGKLFYVHGGPVAATMAASHDFMIGAQRVLVQDVIARMARVSDRVNVLDVEYLLTPVDGDIDLGSNFYSCLQLRGAASFNKSNLVFTYADGKAHRDVDRRNEQPPEDPPCDRWIDETGPVDGKTVGATVAIHPTAPKSRTCGADGVKGLNLNFVYDGPMKLKAGVTIRARYQIYAHDGTAAEAKVGAIAEWFNPGVEVKWRD